jgi:hypothetical protein
MENTVQRVVLNSLVESFYSALCWMILIVSSLSVSFQLLTSPAEFDNALGNRCHTCIADRQPKPAVVSEEWSTKGWPQSSLLNWGESESDSSLPPLLPSSLLFSDSPLSSDLESEEDEVVEKKLLVLREENRERGERLSAMMGTIELPILIN